MGIVPWRSLRSSCNLPAWRATTAESRWYWRRAYTRHGSWRRSTRLPGPVAHIPTVWAGCRCPGESDSCPYRRLTCNRPGRAVESCINVPVSRGALEMTLIGSEILAKALKRQDVECFFYLMGGPMMAAETATMAEGIRGIDVRHEQAAAMMAHAWARIRNRPGVCMAASGPGTTNLITGVAHAWADCVPVVALGGSAPAWSVRARCVSGDRSAFDDEARDEVGRAGARSTQDSGVRRSRVRVRHVGQARTGVPRPSGRCALHPGRGGRHPPGRHRRTEGTATARVLRPQRSQTSFAGSRRRSDPLSSREEAFSGQRRKRHSRPSSSVSEFPSSRRPRVEG